MIRSGPAGRVLLDKGRRSADIIRIRSALEQNHELITAQVPTRFDFVVDGSSGHEISDGGSDMYDGGNWIFTSRGGMLQYTDGRIKNGGLFGPGSAYFTFDLPGLFTLVATSIDITSIGIDGDNGADGSGSTDIVELTSGFGDFTIFCKRVWGTSDPSINQIFVVAGDGTGITQTASSDTNRGLHELDGIGSLGRIYYILVARTSGALLADASVIAVADAFLSVVESI